MKNNTLLKTVFLDPIDAISKMTPKERMEKLCKLLVREQLCVILPHEIVQLEMIQAIRKANGEIDKVLQGWKDNPELDPRPINERG